MKKILNWLVPTIITILLAAIALISTFYFNIKSDFKVITEENSILKDTLSNVDNEFLSSFKIPNKETFEEISCGQINVISGTYKNTFTTKWDVYPVVKAPDYHYYPNKKIVLNASDSTWSSYVWIGSPNNRTGEKFEILFVAVRPGISREFADLEETDGKENIGKNLPPGVLVLQSLMVKCK